jgi:hypothetical protein
VPITSPLAGEIAVKASSSHIAKTQFKTWYLISESDGCPVRYLTTWYLISESDGCPVRYLTLTPNSRPASLPSAARPLVVYYRSISGEHPDWNDYRTAMIKQRRCLIRITPTKAGPTVFG